VELKIGGRGEESTQDDGVLTLTALEVHVEGAASLGGGQDPSLKRTEVVRCLMVSPLSDGDEPP
jgi:hypothetical protein